MKFYDLLYVVGSAIIGIAAISEYREKKRARTWNAAVSEEPTGDDSTASE